MKPVIRCEATFESSAGVLRGERGQRAGTVGLGRLGDPCRRFLYWNETRRESISGGLEAGESERLIVAWKSRQRGMERRGLGRSEADSKSLGS